MLTLVFLHGIAGLKREISPSTLIVFEGGSQITPSWPVELDQNLGGELPVDFCADLNLLGIITSMDIQDIPSLNGRHMPATVQ